MLKGLGAVCCSLILLMFAACSGAPPADQVTYYYYPAKNVYYDVRRNVFIYSLDGGKTWINYERTISNEPPGLGDKIALYDEAQDLYLQNADHLRLYGGRVMNIVQQDTAKPGLPEIAERIVVRKQPVTDTIVAEKPRKGLSRFFNKIFGRHKKKD